MSIYIGNAINLILLTFFNDMKIVYPWMPRINATENVDVTDIVDDEVPEDDIYY